MSVMQNRLLARVSARSVLRAFTGAATVVVLASVLLNTRPGT